MIILDHRTPKLLRLTVILLHCILKSKQAKNFFLLLTISKSVHTLQTCRYQLMMILDCHSLPFTLTLILLHWILGSKLLWKVFILSTDNGEHLYTSEQPSDIPRPSGLSYCPRSHSYPPLYPATFASSTLSPIGDQSFAQPPPLVSTGSLVQHVSMSYAPSANVLYAPVVPCSNPDPCQTRIFSGYVS